MTGLGVENIPDIVFAYWSHINFMEQNPGLYGMDTMREELHQELCDYYRISKGVSKKVTDNIHNYETAIDLHFALLDI